MSRFYIVSDIPESYVRSERTSPSLTASQREVSRYLQAYGRGLEGAVYGEQYREDHYGSSRGTPKRNLQILRHSTILIKPRFSMSYQLCSLRVLR